MTTTVSDLSGTPKTLYDEADEVLTPLDATSAGSVNLAEVIHVSFDSLSANKTRSALTMLGVIIGVASVVALLALGNGAQASITTQITSIGTNLIFVMPGSPSASGPGSSSTAQTLTMDDVQAVATLGLPLNGMAPTFSGTANVVAPAADKYTSITGTTPEYFAMQDLHAAAGTLFDAAQNHDGAAVAVLGANLAADLFGSGTGVGQTVRIHDQRLRVIGVLAAKGGGGMGSDDDEFFAPISFVQQRLFGARTPDGNSYRVAVILLSARNGGDIQAIQDRITVVLRERHHLKADGSADDFIIMNQASFLSTLNSITSLFTTFLAAIAAISLLVGGIGIMNIMLVSVTERTREIGLRKAVGARGRDILLQFIVEAVVISLMGGLLGLGLGALVALLVTVTGILTTSISLSSVVLALTFSMGVGLFFGIYPARRAARLNPIDALRFE